MQAKRILIADDNDDLRASVGAFLKLKGYEELLINKLRK